MNAVTAPANEKRRIERGFDQPVIGAQVAFRAILDALANPGVAHEVKVSLPKIGVSQSALAALLALVDIDTPLWLPTSIAEDTRTYLRFHTGVRFAPTHTTCAFAYVASVAELPPIAQFPAGSAMSPELSATVIIAVESLTGGVEATLDGPGCKEPRSLAPAGFTADTWQQLIANSNRFPAGVDVLIACERSVVGLPRSTRITVAHASTKSSNEPTQEL